MSSDRVVATLIGLALMSYFPSCSYTPALVIPLLVYSLFPRKGVRMRSRAVKVVGKTVGCLALALSLLLLAGLLMAGAPMGCACISSDFFSIPSAALTLYGFEISTVSRFSVKVAVYMRVLIVAPYNPSIGLRHNRGLRRPNALRRGISK